MIQSKNNHQLEACKKRYLGYSNSTLKYMYMSSIGLDRASIYLVLKERGYQVKDGELKKLVDDDNIIGLVDGGYLDKL